MGDMEICCRIAHYTPYKMGFLPTVEIDQVQSVACEDCAVKGLCSLDRKTQNCFALREKRYKNPQFRNTYGWKYTKFLSEMEKGRGAAFCASIHDEASMKTHWYNRQMAEENFRFYRDYAN